MKTICITGAAGNLGSLTAQHLLGNTDYKLRLMIHRKPFPFSIHDKNRASAYSCDLANKDSLGKILEGVDEIIHYAGVLFQAHPEHFLPITNTLYFQNLMEVAKAKGVKRIILISFPHVEGETSPTHPSTNRLDRTPISSHAQTRKEEERILFQHYPESVVLRVGMVYGRGILMPDAARWFAQRRLLGVWKKPTLIHLISKDDYLISIQKTIENDSLAGTYNIGDEGIQTLQEYLDFACDQWKCPRPWRMPLWLINTAASLFETASSLFKIKSPLTRDFIRIGRVSYYGDTTRMRAEILPNLKYPTMKHGASIF